MRYPLAVASLLSALVAAPPADAHIVALGLLSLNQRPDGLFWVTWKLDRPGVDLMPTLPGHCQRRPPRSGKGLANGPWPVDCGEAGIIGAPIGFHSGTGRNADVVVKITLGDGQRFTGLARGGATITLWPEAEGRGNDTFLSYLGYGVQHIIGGYDHLLFVLGLILLMRRWRPLLGAVTTFTVAHSISLALSALELLRLPTAPVEATIALSVLFLARELAGDGATSKKRQRYLPAMTFAFGLLHGLAFAGALADIGLPQTQLPVALLGFNCGVELGQLAFIPIASLALLLLRRLRGVVGVPIPRVTRIAAYGMGAVAAAWTIERVARFV